MTDKRYYKNLYDWVGEEIGWDFRHLGEIKEGRKWDFFQEVVKKAKNNHMLLDLGTGGGERVLEIAGEVLLIIGIDRSSSMIKTARKNRIKKGVANVRFIKMNSNSLEFPNNFFDIVTSRHCDFSAKEVYRVLRKGGYLLTQQVSEHDKINIKKVFKRGQHYGKGDGELKEQYLQELEKVGFKNIQSDDYDSVEYYKQKEDIIHLLRHTPIVPRFGEEDKDFEKLEMFFDNYTTDRGIKTNSKRFKIVAQK